MRMAAASKEDVALMREFLRDLEAACNGDYTIPKGTEGEDEEDIVDMSDERLAQFVRCEFSRIRLHYERILSGYNVMYDNACDPTLSHLEFKPEILRRLAPQNVESREDIIKLFGNIVRVEVTDDQMELIVRLALDRFSDGAVGGSVHFVNGTAYNFVRKGGDETVACSVCHQHYFNWAGPSPCCSAPLQIVTGETEYVDTMEQLKAFNRAASEHGFISREGVIENAGNYKILQKIVGESWVFTVNTGACAAGNSESVTFSVHPHEDKDAIIKQGFRAYIYEDNRWCRITNVNGTMITVIAEDAGYLIHIRPNTKVLIAAGGQEKEAYPRLIRGLDGLNFFDKMFGDGKEGKKD